MIAEAASNSANSTDATDVTGIDQTPSSWAAITQLASAYVKLSGSLADLFFADGKLAAVSLFHIITAAILAAFISIAAWMCFVALIVACLMAYGIDAPLLLGLVLCLHVVVLVVVAMSVRRMAKRLTFSATREALASDSAD